MDTEPISSLALMERAATAAFHWIDKLLVHHPERPVIVLCGPGNNGGDGLVIARLLYKHARKTTVYVVDADAYSDDHLHNLQKLRQTHVPLYHVKAEDELIIPDSGAVIIDALFGSGLNRSLAGVAAKMVKAVNDSNNNIVIAIDVPSGLFTDSANGAADIILKATHTLSFQCAKPCFFIPGHEFFLGRWHLLNIGLHPAFIEEVEAYAQVIDAHAPFIFPPLYSTFAHKGSRGTCLLMEGHTSYSGAALLAAGSALRSGVGLVLIQSAAKNHQLFTSKFSELVLVSSDLPFWQQAQYAQKVKAVGMGFGWPAQDDALVALLRDTLTHYNEALLLDAGALRMLAGDINLLRLRKQESFTVITPHIGEFDALAGTSANAYERIGKAKQMAIEHNITIVLKGHHTMVFTPGGKMYINNSGNNGMAKGGTGDVLSGLMTGLLAQPIPPLQAVLLAVYLHGLAGDICAGAMGTQAMQPGDMINYLPAAWQQLSGYHH